MKKTTTIRLAGSLVAASMLASCGGVNFDHLGPGLKRRTEVNTMAPRPEEDANGVISYASYQVAAARDGDTVADVAIRVGLTPAEVARFNGLSENHELRDGEILALPRRVETTVGGIDIASIAGSAIDRADSDDNDTTATSTTNSGIEPIRHRVESGETVYSIARLYDVSVRSLADWNGLGADLSVRTGQFLLIPIVLKRAAVSDESNPGEGTVTPTPPSASQPLPEAVETATLPSSGNINQTDTEDKSKFLMPVNGKIIKGYSSKNEGIDIAAASGSTVLAAADGEVALISRSVGQSTIVLVRHSNNIYTVYSNVTGVTLRKGTSIKRGQPVGKIAAGDPSFLHFEVRRGTASTDPMPFLQ